MGFGFAFFVVISAIVVFFHEEIADFLKKQWNKPWLRNGGLMFFIGFFGFAYKDFLKMILQVMLAYCQATGVTIAPYIPFVPDKLLVAFALLHLFLTAVLVGCSIGIYYLIWKKLCPFIINLMWGVWLVIATIFLTV